MFSPLLTENLARQRHQDNLDAAAWRHLARGSLTPHRYRLRSRAGWWLVQTGIRLALTDDLPLHTPDRSRKDPTAPSAAAGGGAPTPRRPRDRALALDT
jgi:hypothetical protein